MDDYLQTSFLNEEELASMMPPLFTSIARSSGNDTQDHRADSMDPSFWSLRITYFSDAANVQRVVTFAEGRFWACEVLEAALIRGTVFIKVEFMVPCVDFRHIAELIRVLGERTCTQGLDSEPTEA